MNRKISLKKNHDIQVLIKNKKSVGSLYYAIYYEKNETLKVCVSVSKKLGIAVVRNYNKRVTKEILREKLKTTDKYKILIVVKLRSLELSFIEKEKEIEKLLEKMRIKN